MKGPSLPLELRVLRVFVCQACGRSVFVPGAVTSHLCSCSDPPKFMQPQERPVTKSPDVTAFLSPPDPADLVEEPEVELEPYVPYVPKLPQRPPQFASRRKLSDEIEKFVPAEFGDGLESPGNSTVAGNTPDAPVQESAGRLDQRDRQRSDRHGGADRSPDGRGPRNDRRDRQDTRGGQRPQGRPTGPKPPHSRRPEPQSDPNRADEGTPVEQAPSSQPELSENGHRSRRNRRRRGRNSSELTDAASSPTDNMSTDVTSEDEFGSGIEASLPRTDAGPRKSSRSDLGKVSSPPVDSQRSPDSEDELDDLNSEEDASGSDAAPDSAQPGNGRRRRNRRRGRRRGRGPEGGAGNAGVPAE